MPCAKCVSSFDVQDAKYTHPPEAFVCPPCRFRNMDPLNEVVPKGLLKCALLVRGSLEISVDLPDLRQWRRDSLAIEVRMVHMDSRKVCHAWPRTLKFTANGSEVFSVRPPEEGHKRRDVPQGVSAGLRPGLNSISVRVQDDFSDDFVLALAVTKQVDVTELRRRVAASDPEESRRRAMAMLAAGRGGDASGVECLTSDTLKLKCPITMEKIVEPVRGRHCQHLQCFSLEAYLTSNRQMRAFNNRWACPVCSQRTWPADLCHDAYASLVLASAPEGVEEAVLLPDGKFTYSSAAASKPALGESDVFGGEVTCLDVTLSPQHCVSSSSGARVPPALALEPKCLAAPVAGLELFTDLGSKAPFGLPGISRSPPVELGANVECESFVAPCTPDVEVCQRARSITPAQFDLPAGRGHHASASPVQLDSPVMPLDTNVPSALAPAAAAPAALPRAPSMLPPASAPAPPSDPLAALRGVSGAPPPALAVPAAQRGWSTAGWGPCPTRTHSQRRLRGKSPPVDGRAAATATAAAEAASRAAWLASGAPQHPLGDARGAGLAQSSVGPVQRAGTEPTPATCSGALPGPACLELISPMRRSKRIRLSGAGSPVAASDSGSGTPSVLIAPSATVAAIDLDDISDSSPACALGPIGTAGAGDSGRRLGPRVGCSASLA